MSTSPLTVVAVAVVLNEGHVLIGQRPAGVPLAGLWEFPGGKVLPRETPAAAAERECLEETGLAVQVREEFPGVSHEYPHGSLQLHFFRCRPVDPNQLVAAPFIWTPLAELDRFEFPAANAPLLTLLRDRKVRNDSGE